MIISKRLLLLLLVYNQMEEIIKTWSKLQLGRWSVEDGETEKKKKTKELISIRLLTCVAGHRNAHGK